MRKLILSMIGMAVYRWLTSSSKKSGSRDYASRDARRTDSRRDRG